MRSNALRKEFDSEDQGELVGRERSHLRVVESGELQMEATPVSFAGVAPFLFVMVAICAALIAWTVLGFMGVVPAPTPPVGGIM